MKIFKFKRFILKLSDHFCCNPNENIHYKVMKIFETRAINSRTWAGPGINNMLICYFHVISLLGYTPICIRLDYFLNSNCP